MAEDAMAKHMAKIKKMHEREAKAKAKKKSKTVASKPKAKAKKKPKLTTKKKKSSTIKSSVARRDAMLEDLMMKLKGK